MSYIPHGDPRRDENFNRWFKNSKVADKHGNPLVVYHGTKSDVASFDKKKHGATDTGLVGRGFYFTPSREQASAFAESPHYGKGNAPNVIPAYLSVRNPMVIADGRLPDGRTLTDIHPNGITKASSSAANSMLRSAGHDGAIFTNGGEISQVAAFYPHQIKSSIGNQGTFDPSDPDITKAMGGTVAMADGGGLPELPTLSSVREPRQLPGQHAEAPHAHKLHVGPIHSAVAGRTDHLPTHVPSGSYVLPADVVSGMGEGNTINGFKVMKRIFSGIPYGGEGNPYRQGTLPYGRAKGGQVKDEGVACVLAGGEYVIAPHHVTYIGKGDRDAGHKALDAFVLQSRAKHIKTLKKLPGPARD